MRMIHALSFLDDMYASRPCKFSIVCILETVDTLFGSSNLSKRF